MAFFNMQNSLVPRNDPWPNQTSQNFPREHTQAYQIHGHDLTTDHHVFEDTPGNSASILNTTGQPYGSVYETYPQYDSWFFRYGLSKFDPLQHTLISQQFFDISVYDQWLVFKFKVPLLGKYIGSEFIYQRCKDALRRNAAISVGIPNTSWSARYFPTQDSALSIVEEDIPRSTYRNLKKVFREDPNQLSRFTVNYRRVQRDTATALIPISSEYNFSLQPRVNHAESFQFQASSYCSRERTRYEIENYDWASLTRTPYEILSEIKYGDNFFYKEEKERKSTFSPAGATIPVGFALLNVEKGAFDFTSSTLEADMFSTEEIRCVKTESSEYVSAWTARCIPYGLKFQAFNGLIFTSKNSENDYTRKIFKITPQHRYQIYDIVENEQLTDEQPHLKQVTKGSQSAHETSIQWMIPIPAWKPFNVIYYANQRMKKNEKRHFPVATKTDPNFHQIYTKTNIFMLFNGSILDNKKYDSSEIISKVRYTNKIKSLTENIYVVEHEHLDFSRMELVSSFDADRVTRSQEKRTKSPEDIRVVKDKWSWLRSSWPAKLVYWEKNKIRSYFVNRFIKKFKDYNSTDQATVINPWSSDMITSTYPICELIFRDNDIEKLCQILQSNAILSSDIAEKFKISEHCFSFFRRNLIWAPTILEKSRIISEFHLTFSEKSISALLYILNFPTTPAQTPPLDISKNKFVFNNEITLLEKYLLEKNNGKSSKSFRRKKQESTANSDSKPILRQDQIMSPTPEIPSIFRPSEIEKSMAPVNPQDRIDPRYESAQHFFAPGPDSIDSESTYSSDSLPIAFDANTSIPENYLSSIPQTSRIIELAPGQQIYMQNAEALEPFISAREYMDFDQPKYTGSWSIHNPDLQQRAASTGTSPQQEQPPFFESPEAQNSAHLDSQPYTAYDSDSDNESSISGVIENEFNTNLVSSEIDFYLISEHAISETGSISESELPDLQYPVPRSNINIQSIDRLVDPRHLQIPSHNVENSNSHTPNDNSNLYISESDAEHDYDMGRSPRSDSPSTASYFSNIGRMNRNETYESKTQEIQNKISNIASKVTNAKDSFHNNVTSSIQRVLHNRSPKVPIDAPPFEPEDNMPTTQHEVRQRRYFRKWKIALYPYLYESVTHKIRYQDELYRHLAYISQNAYIFSKTDKVSYERAQTDMDMAFDYLTYLQKIQDRALRDTRLRDVDAHCIRMFPQAMKELIRYDLFGGDPKSENIEQSESIREMFNQQWPNDFAQQCIVVASLQNINQLPECIKLEILDPESGIYSEHYSNIFGLRQHFNRSLNVLQQSIRAIQNNPAISTEHQIRLITQANLTLNCLKNKLSILLHRSQEREDSKRFFSVYQTYGRFWFFKPSAYKILLFKLNYQLRAYFLPKPNTVPQY